jgi:NADH:ubiquinone oxidoreductase subunit 5 (subunit L)/multisubunit Na+/H+ antiporter MnhA subunit
MPSNLVWLIPLLPILAAGWIAIGYISGWNRGERGERETARITLAAALASLLLGLGIALESLLSGLPGEILVANWLSSGDHKLNISFLLDRNGMLLMLLVTTLAMLVMRFSVNYMHREAGFQRFFMILSLFMGAMLLIVMSGNAGLMFIGWELAGVSSYLLIGYAFERETATANANRAFITNRIGDAGFIVALSTAFLFFGGLEWSTLQGKSEGLDALHANLLAIGFVIAALAKSAQLPFSAWISRALEGPTPSSAIFYGSLMVHAGVVLIIRLEPVLDHAPVIMFMIASLGAATAFYGWLSGLTQTDIKSSLMFSTIAQTGLMFLWCGLGWYELALWHLIAHAIWRAYQFLHAPALMHLVSRGARPAPLWLRHSQRLHNLSLQRFWLDPLTQWLLVRPTRALARDAKQFDEQVVTRAVGLPHQAQALSSSSDSDAGWSGDAEGDVGRGRGIAGRLMEWIASMMHWFEEHLVLQGGGQGLMKAIHHLGRHLNRVEQLLSQPRYLLLLIMATVVVIL